MYPSGGWSLLHIYTFKACKMHNPTNNESRWLQKTLTNHPIMKTLNQQVWSIKQKHYLKGGILGLFQVGRSPPQSTQNLGS